MDFTSWLLVVTIIFASALVQGFTGFGLGMVAIPMLTIHMEVHRSVILCTALAVIACLLGAVRQRRAVNWRVASLWSAGALLGLPGGVLLFVLAPVEVLTLVVAATVIGLAVVLLLDVHAAASQSVRRLLSVGASAGVLAGAIGMGGPPIALHSTWSRYPKDVFQATAAAFGAAVSGAALLGYSLAGGFSLDVIVLSLTLVPAVLAGTLAGLQMNRVLPQQWFQRIVLLALIATALQLVLRTY